MTTAIDAQTGEITPIGLVAGFHGVRDAQIALFKALSDAQGSLSNVTKDSNNPLYNKSYASLPAVLDVLRPALLANGLAVVQNPQGDQLATVVTHVSGASYVSFMALKMGKNDMQGLGSAVKYARRYALEALFALAGEDDDGNAAVGAQARPQAGAAVSATASPRAEQPGAAPAAAPKAKAPAAAVATASTLGRITDAKAPAMKDALAKVAAAPDLNRLEVIETFAKTKYGGDALTEIENAIAERRSTLQEGAGAQTA